MRIDGRYDAVALPTLHLGGWYDCFIGETIRQYVAMRERAEANGTRPPRLIVGPWTHGMFANVVGEVDFGMASNGAFRGGRGDLTTLHQRWFDATLKGDEAGLATEPAVQLFVMGENRWRTYDTWPVPGAQEERWFLASGGHANTRYGDGTLGRTQAPGADADTFAYDPAEPVPTRGGATLLHPAIPRGAVDQGPNEDRPDVLCYTSEPFAAPYTVIGTVAVTLFAASSAPDTDFVARLVDVYPDGRAIGDRRRDHPRQRARQLPGWRVRLHRADPDRAGADLRIHDRPLGDRDHLPPRPSAARGDHQFQLPALGSQPQHRRRQRHHHGDGRRPPADRPRRRAPEQPDGVAGNDSVTAVRRERVLTASEQHVSASAVPVRGTQRRSLPFIALLGLLGFVILLPLARMGTTLGFDREVTHALQQFDSPALLRLMEFISWPGDEPQAIIISLLIAIAFAVARHPLSAAMVVLGTLSLPLNLLLKKVAARPRPSAELDGVIVHGISSGSGFPSGHVMGYVVVLGFLLYLAATRLAAGPPRTAALLLGGFFMVFVGPARIYLGEHWFVDVLGSYCIGVALLIGLILLFERLLRRWPAPAPRNRTAQS